MRSIDMQNTPEDSEMKKGGETVRRARRARGGKSGHEIYEYNAKDSPEADEADKEEDGFERGGKTKKKRAAGGIALKDGGHAEGHEPMHRPDRASRSRRAGGGRMHHEEHQEKIEHESEPKEHERRRHGGEAKEEREEREHRASGGRAMAGGHTPFSSGHKGMGRDDKEGPAARGYEGVPVGDAPD